MKKWTTYHSKSSNEKYLYKFLSSENLDLFLRTGSIWFSRADIFGDKMECVRIKDLKKEKPDYNEIKARQKQFLISCWHLADRETLVFWDTYSYKIENRRTVAVRFKRNDLITLIEQYSIRNHLNLFYTTEFIHGIIVYKNLIGENSDLLSDKAVLYPAFRKEAAFKYENEYRFVIQLDHPHPEVGYGYGYRIDEAQSLPFNIIINPLLDNNWYLRIKEQIEIAGFVNKLRPSDLASWLHPELW